MLNVSAVELLVILAVGLIVLGPQKLPGAARQVGRVLTELRRMAAGFQAEMRDALAEASPTEPAPLAPPPAPRGPLAPPLEPGGSGAARPAAPRPARSTPSGRGPLAPPEDPA